MDTAMDMEQDKAQGTDQSHRRSVNKLVPP